MSLPLCQPEELKCVQNITYNECLPQCSGLWITNYEGNSDWEKFKISKLSKQYWNFKGFYKFSDFKGHSIPKPTLIRLLPLKVFRLTFIDFEFL